MNDVKLTPIAKSLQRGLGLPVEEFLKKYDVYGNEKFTYGEAMSFFKEEGIKINYYHETDRKIKVALALPMGRTETFTGVTWGHIIRKVKNELVEAEFAF